MLNTWIILIVAIAAETFATTMVRASEGFTRLLPSLGVVAPVMPCHFTDSLRSLRS